MGVKEEFIELYTSQIHRDGAESLLDYLQNKSDFFTCPASAKFHGAYAGGLCEHSLNVYRCLADYLAHLCKIGCYKAGTRNVKGPDGKWQSVPTFFYEDPLPYGHGEKSVYIITGFMRLSREEAMAIRWHMGFSGSEDPRMVGQALEQYPLAFALSVADMEATYFLEKREG